MVSAPRLVRVFVVEGERGVQLEGVEVTVVGVHVHLWMAAQPSALRRQRDRT